MNDDDLQNATDVAFRIVCTYGMGESKLTKKIFAVKRGRKTGIFNNWVKCHKQLVVYPNPEYFSFEYRSELEAEPEDVPGSLRYAMKKAKEFLGDLIYLGVSVDYLEDATWKRYGFLPFGEDFSDSEQLMENLEDLENIEEEDDEWLADDINTHDMSLGSWDDNINTHRVSLGSWDAENEEDDEWLTDNINTHDMSMKSWDVEMRYWKIAAAMKKCVERIRYGSSDLEKQEAADSLKAHLERCVMDKNLKDITKIYRDKKEKNAIGYNLSAVKEFVGVLANRYLKPKIIETEEGDSAAGIENDPQTLEEKRFDVLNIRHRDALMDLMVQMVRRQIIPPNGVGLSRFGSEWEMCVNGKTIAIYGIQDEDDEDAYYCTMVHDYSLVSELVNGTPGLLELVLQKITEGDY